MVAVLHWEDCEIGYDSELAFVCRQLLILDSMRTYYVVVYAVEPLKKDQNYRITNIKCVNLFIFFWHNVDL